MPYVTNEGAEIHYHLEQEISGPPLATDRPVMILSHGFMMDTTCWYKHGYVQELKKNFDLLIVDARGHGLSSKPHTPAEYEDKTMARDVLAVMDDADVKTASFFGFSMGGRTGLELAYIEPRRFNFFVIASATPGPRTEVGIKSDIRRIKSFSQGKVAVASFMDRIGAEMDPYRKEAIENLGAKVEIVGKNSDEADLFAKQLSKEKNITLIHPFDDEDIIIGQGTVGLEMLKEFPEVDTVIIPTSGGGLISGIAQAIKLQKPDTKVIAVSMERGPSMYESLKKGEPVDVDEIETLADCLGGSIGLDNKFTFNIVKQYVDDFVLVSEEKIAEGIRMNFMEHKIVSEGAAATSVMVVKDKLTSHLGKNIICLICGGNIDSELFNKVLSNAHP